MFLGDTVYLRLYDFYAVHIRLTAVVDCSAWPFIGGCQYARLLGNFNAESEEASYLDFSITE